MIANLPFTELHKLKQQTKSGKEEKKGKGIKRRTRTYFGNTPLVTMQRVYSILQSTHYYSTVFSNTTSIPIPNPKAKAPPHPLLADLFRTPIITNTAPHQQTTSPKIVPAEH